ncbi:ABC transporter ATP-binding protein [Methylophaga nitratireducenticrescens]|uniref:ABC transporter ATP-binding protein n=1 Tax=Methylophaga nitratireducenticrescens TaxID=754476 RepID=I1XH42_METNJ|nr:ATP-binding cassette domain-containing protein [Methylophaga nitratireducenticrescens]AFI83711.1 ABC transporter ATP-binding protein [Methylophaga nitratireducenticrescens]
MDSEFAIKTNGLTKQYGQAVVVNGLDLQVKAGQCYGLLGPNGAGKSTTIHMLTTMTSPSAGEGWIANQSISADPVAIRGLVGLVFQDSALDRTMTVDENLQFAAALYGMSKKQANERIEELLAVFNLGSRRNAKLLALSGGQRRAVDIARGVLHQPQVLFLDEPTIGLDLPNRRSIWRFVEQLRRNHGMTVFLTTHYLEEAAACDHVDFIQRGVLQKGGKPVDLMRQLAAYVLEIETVDIEPVVSKLTPQFGNPIIEDEQLSFLIKDAKTDLHALQQSLGDSITAMRWRKPNLNDVYLWKVCPPDQEPSA